VPPPSLFHEAPIEVLRQQPRTILELLRLAGQALPASDPSSVAVEVVDSALTEPQPKVGQADLVVRLADADGRTLQLVVLEVQSATDPDKPAAWLHYVARLVTLHRAPVTVIVIALASGVARWARRPTSFGPNLRFTPIVLGPNDFPEIASVEEAVRRRDLAVLTALVRAAAKSKKALVAADAEILRVFRATMQTRASELRKVYVSLIDGVARPELRATLRTLLEADGMGALEMIFENGKAEGIAEGKAVGRAEGKVEGKAEGEAEGEARALLVLLHKRGFAVSPELEQRVRATASIETLDRWLGRVLDAKSVEDVFAE
jgi:hypothetical protein